MVNPAETAEKLPALVMHEHAYSTEKKYVQAFKRFQEWWEAMGVLYLPAAPEHVALYFEVLLKNKSFFCHEVSIEKQEGQKTFR